MLCFSRYFANVAVRDEHFKTKRHKKRYVYLCEVSKFVAVIKKMQICRWTFYD